MMGSYHETVCAVANLEMYFILFLIGATLIALSVITLDRYIAVCHSYRYVQLVTNSRVRKLLVIVWFLWITISVARMICSRLLLILIILLSLIVIFISFS